MNLDLFPRQADVHTTENLTDRIARYTLTQPPLNGVNDKWLLASNLQKAIRRGLAPNAVATALALQALDSRYFWRRLLVIAYEDVGIANVVLCHDLLKSFRREAMHLRLGPERVAAFFAETLAKSLKSRALCDAIAMLEFDPQLAEHEKKWFGVSDAEIVIAVNCTEVSPSKRVAALRHICGYREKAYGSFRLATPVRKDLMQAVCRRAALSEMETALFLAGSQTTESLNVALPIVAAFARAGWKEEARPQVFDGVRGVLFAALDRHTRAGKGCFAEFAASVKPINDFFRQHPKLNPVAVLGVVLFIIEGSSLSRWAVFQQSDSLRRTFERIFLEHVGVDESMASDLLPIVSDNLPALNAIRKAAIVC